MTEEEYAIVSKKEFLKLKQELDKLKKNPLEGSPAGANLQESIESLNKSLTGMMELFKEAGDQLKIEERDTQIVAKKLDPITDKIETLIEQNQKIAKGIIAVADMVKEKLDEIEAKTSAPKHVEEKPELPPLGGAPPPPGPEPMGPPSGPGMAPPMPGPAPMGPEPMPQGPGAPMPEMPPFGAPEPGFGAPPPMPGPAPMGPPGPGAPPGSEMPGPMPPPPADRGRKKPILGGFLAK